MVVASGARGEKGSWGRDDDREAWREEASVIETMMGGGRGERGGAEKERSIEDGSLCWAQTFGWRPFRPA